jgi:hypothetical protein
MAFKTKKTDEFINEVVEEKEKTDYKKSEQFLVYLTKENRDFLDRLKFANRAAKVSISDFINEAISQYLMKKYKNVIGEEK